MLVVDFVCCVLVADVILFDVLMMLVIVLLWPVACDV